MLNCARRAGEYSTGREEEALEKASPAETRWLSTFGFCATDVLKNDARPVHVNRSDVFD